MATGLIPAHAGKTRPEAYDELIRAAHPRSRGENDPITGDLEFKAGSSPLTRGKPLYLRLALTALRLIPAHAGKTQPPRQASGGCWAHPRSRGENRRDLLHHVTPPGSSPLTRGKHSYS